MQAAGDLGPGWTPGRAGAGCWMRPPGGPGGG